MKDKVRTAFAEIHADNALIYGTLDYLRKETVKKRKDGEGLTFPVRLGAVCAVVLFVVGIFSYNLYFTAASHVGIDVNPSVELTLNRFDRVIDAYAFNADGVGILNETGLRGKTYGDAAGLLLSAIEANGYISEDTLISVTVQTANRKKEQTLCEVLKETLNEKILPIQTAAEIEVFPVSSEVWLNAHVCHVSPARFLAIQELIEVDNTATVEAYADEPIRQIRRRTQECRSGHTESNGGNPEAGPWNGHGGGHGHNREH